MRRTAGADGRGSSRVTRHMDWQNGSWQEHVRDWRPLSWSNEEQFWSSKDSSFSNDSAEEKKAVQRH